MSGEDRYDEEQAEKERRAARKKVHELRQALLHGVTESLTD
jgi:hypothetical protein